MGKKAPKKLWIRDGGERPPMIWPIEVDNAEHYIHADVVDERIAELGNQLTARQLENVDLHKICEKSERRIAELEAHVERQENIIKQYLDIAELLALYVSQTEET